MLQRLNSIGRQKPTLTVPTPHITALPEGIALVDRGSSSRPVMRGGLMRMRIAAALVCVILVLWGGTPFLTYGQDGGQTEHVETVTVPYEVSLQGRTPEEARAVALSRARAEAVRRVAGVHVRAERSSMSVDVGQGVGGPGVERRFTQNIRSSTSGRVIQETVLEEGIQSRSNETVYFVRLDATVHVQAGGADPGFTATLTLKDSDRTYVARIPRAASDEVVVTAEVSKDAFVTLLSITADTIEVVWPNALVAENRVPAQVPVEFPSPEWRARGLRFRAALPEGVHHRTERLMLVATKERVPFDAIPNLAVQDGTLATHEATLHALNRWLVQIPLDQRTTATATYYVKRDTP